MACQITVFPPFGQETISGSGITLLRVSGTATDCTSVLVQVHQNQPLNASTPQKTVVVTAGQWNVDFTVALGDFALGTFLCGGGNKYIIEAICATDSSCKGGMSSNVVNCNNCPNVEIVITPGDCVNGRRTVNIKAEVISANDASFSWFFGVDEDAQPGEDNEAGGWLPPPSSSGVRVVETNHVSNY